MKAYIVILLLATCCGLLAWIAWKVTILVESVKLTGSELTSELRQGVDRMVRDIPPAIYIPPYPEPPAAPAPPITVGPAWGLSSIPKPANQDYEILKRVNGELVHHCWRHAGSADISEALTHPELAIRRPDGTIEGDSQC
jgi:hypothetical protein